MKVPLNWLKEYVTLPEKQEELTHKLTMVGHMLDKLEHKNGTPIIDLELRGNRADCYSILGIAREISALYKTSVTYPKIYQQTKILNDTFPVKLSVKTDLVKRVMMAQIKNVVITESPRWLKEKIESYGMASINNFVDLTNYVMIETGQPMHAFDNDKIGTNLEIRLAHAGEKMTTFQGIDVSLTKDDLVWANQDKILSVAGAIGGKDDSLSIHTKNVLLEAASYDRANIRRSIHRLNLLTEAGIRHEKELDPNLVDFGISRFLSLVSDNKWGDVENIVSDYYPNKHTSWSVSLSYDYLSSLTGIAISPKEIEEILTLLQFRVTKKDSNGITVEVPTYRTDVQLEEDLVEEIIRMYGYDKIPAQTLSLEIPEDVTPSYITQETEIKRALVEIGFDEIITLPFIKEDHLAINTPIPERPVSMVKVVNRPSHDFEYLRMSMLPNLYAVTKKIQDERGNLSQLFEIGKTYVKKGSEYIESRNLGILYWEKNADFTTFKGFLELLFHKLLLPKGKYKLLKKSSSILTNTFSISLKTEVVGVGGMYKDMYFLQIDLEKLLGKEGKRKAQMWPKYPPQIEDITLLVPDATHIGEIVDAFEKEKLVSEINLTTIYENAYTFRVYFQSDEKTLTDNEVTAIREKILSNLMKIYKVTLKV